MTLADIQYKYKAPVSTGAFFISQDVVKTIDMSRLVALNKAIPNLPKFPKGNITRHFKYNDMLCRGFETSSCRAEPPFKVRLNLEIVFCDLAEPFTQHLFNLMIRKSPVVAQSYICPKCLELRGRYQWDSHAKGRAIDLLFTGQKRVSSWILYDIALFWGIRSDIQCILYPEGSCLHLELDHKVGYKCL